MSYKVLIFLLCLAGGNFLTPGQTSEKSESSSVKTVSLRKVAKYGSDYTEKTLKISNVILEDVRGFETDWAYLFQLYDPRKKFRRGAKKENENPCCIQEFSIFTDEKIATPLIEQKAEWLNRKVNVYIKITDRGLTPLNNIGYVIKIELLNEKGRVEKTLMRDW